MHTEMWEHPATVANVATLRERGRRSCIEPAVGRLTGADTGKGRLPDPAEIFAVGTAAAARGRSPRRPGRPARRGHRRRHPRAARPGAVPRQPVLGQAGVRVRPHRRGPGRPGHADRGQRRPARSGRRRPWSGSAPPRSCARPRWRRRPDADVGGDGGRAGRLPARPSTRRRKIKKSDDGDGADARSWSRTPTSPPSWASASAPGQVLVAFAAETARRGRPTRARS